MTDSFKNTLAWLATGTLAVFMAMNWASASYTGTEYLPAGNDSFYHARRILDTVRDPAAFFEFDPRMHVPEGSWVVWPWLYDYAVARLVRGVMWVTGADDPMPILVYVPVLWAFVTIGLVLLITGALRLPWSVRIMATLFAALLPLNQTLHGVGSIDHHYMEYTFVLATLLAGLRWFADPGEVPRAVMLGFVLGIACGFHNGLFILQLPVLATILLLWLRGQVIPPRPAIAFAASLLGATLLVLVPSQPFLEGRFEFYLLSWFHLYVAAGTAAVTVFASTRRPSAGGIAVLAILTIVLLAPLAAQVLLAGDFLGRHIARLDTILEARSVLQKMLEQNRGVLAVAALYSGMIFLLPLIAIAVAWRLVREREPSRVFFHVFAGAGLLLMTQQVRLHYFGTFALYLVPALGLAWIMRRYPARARLLGTAGLLVMGLALYPGVRYLLFARQLSGIDRHYQIAREFMPALRERCAANPGVVLTYNDSGHYVRFHTECSVIANNFLLTDLQVAKIGELDRLLNASPEEILATRPDIRYLLLYFPLLYQTLPDGSRRLLGEADLRAANWRFPLIARLLLDDDPTADYPRLRLLKQIVTREEDGREVAIARLFEVRPARAGDGPDATRWTGRLPTPAREAVQGVARRGSAIPSRPPVGGQKLHVPLFILGDAD